MNKDSKKILIYGYGNPGRQDDGLGDALILKIDQARIPNVGTESNYQLNIEDSLTISEFDVVFFVDASLNGEEPFSLEKLEPANEIAFTSHAMAPNSIIALCHDLYDKNIICYLLAIRGYEWEFQEGLSSKALENLNQAYDFLIEKITEIQSHGQLANQCHYKHCNA